jgi:hypothetical protein
MNLQFHKVLKIVELLGEPGLLKESAPSSAVSYWDTEYIVSIDRTRDE